MFGRAGRRPARRRPLVAAVPRAAPCRRRRPEHGPRAVPPRPRRVRRAHRALPRRDPRGRRLPAVPDDAVRGRGIRRSRRDVSRDCARRRRRTTAASCGRATSPCSARAPSGSSTSPGARRDRPHAADQGHAAARGGSGERRRAGGRAARQREGAGRERHDRRPHAQRPLARVPARHGRGRRAPRGGVVPRRASAREHRVRTPRAGHDGRRPARRRAFPPAA